MGEPGIEPPVKQLSLERSAFAWNRFWLSKTAKEIHASLEAAFKLDGPLAALVRGAVVLAVPPADFESLMRSEVSTEGWAFSPDSPAQLLGRIQTDLEHWRTLEKESREYVEEVGRRLDSSPQRRKDVLQAIRPGKLRR